MFDLEDPYTGNIIPGNWRSDLAGSESWIDFSPCCSNNFSNEAKSIREEYKAYFNNEGALSWQWHQCGID